MPKNITFAIVIALLAGCAHAAHSTDQTAPKAASANVSQQLEEAAIKLNAFQTMSRLDEYVAAHNSGDYLDKNGIDRSKMEALIAAARAAVFLAKERFNDPEYDRLWSKWEKQAQAARVRYAFHAIGIVMQFFSEGINETIGPAGRAVAEAHSAIDATGPNGDGPMRLQSSLAVIECQALAVYAKKRVSYLDDCVNGRSVSCKAGAISDAEVALEDLAAASKSCHDRDYAVALVKRFMEIKKSVCEKNGGCDP